MQIAIVVWFLANPWTLSHWNNFQMLWDNNIILKGENSINKVWYSNFWDFKLLLASSFDSVLLFKLTGMPLCILSWVFIY